ncbi:MAG TPA: hypothetical protein VIK59_07110 [Verrucomicrobiae bacterium]
MQLLKARKNARNAAVVSIFLGIAIILTSIFFYLKFIRNFEVLFAHITKDEHAQAIILDLIGINKTFVTILFPTCGIQLIIAGYYTLYYLRKEREESEFQSGR